MDNINTIITELREELQQLQAENKALRELLKKIYDAWEYNKTVSLPAYKNAIKTALNS